MREIKFRGKRKDNGEWVYGTFFVDPKRENFCTIITSYVAITNYNNRAYKDFIVAAETVGQYTGNKDKNGKEIYEGDIIKFRDHKGKDVLFEVRWDTKRAGFFPFTLPDILDLNLFLKSLEVIGNIHESG